MALRQRLDITERRSQRTYEDLVHSFDSSSGQVRIDHVALTLVLFSVVGLVNLNPDTSVWLTEKSLSERDVAAFFYNWFFFMLLSPKTAPFVYGSALREVEYIAVSTPPPKKNVTN